MLPLLQFEEMSLHFQSKYGSSFKMKRRKWCHSCGGKIRMWVHFLDALSQIKRGQKGRISTSPNLNLMAQFQIEIDLNFDLVHRISEKFRSKLFSPQLSLCTRERIELEAESHDALQLSKRPFFLERGFPDWADLLLTGCHPASKSCRKDRFYVTFWKFWVPT